MSVPSHSAGYDAFNKASDDFLVWLQHCPGFRVSPKIKISDLRSNGAGRGVSEYLLELLVFLKTRFHANQSASCLSGHW